MEARFVQAKGSWNEFVTQEQGLFLQSYEWGEFQKNVHGVWRIEVLHEGKKILQAQVIKENLPKGNYLYIPYGPVFSRSASAREWAKAYETLVEVLGQLAQKEGSIFLRIEPFVLLPESRIKSVPSFKRIQPLQTLLIDLTRSEKDLFEGFQHGTRRNVRLAEKRGVEITVSDEYSSEFWLLLKKTRQRQGFHTYSEEYYQQFFRMQGDITVSLYRAEYAGRSIMASIFVFFGNRAVSLHTGNDYAFRALKAANVLRWVSIQEAKRRGYTVYDFWGIDQKRYPGVTAFKKGFGGKEYVYPFSLDIVFHKAWYHIYQSANALKRFL